MSPTNLSQFNLPGPSMMRSNSIPAQDTSFDLYDDSQLCGSAISLEERPRAISHSGSFRDSMEEGKTELLFESLNRPQNHQYFFYNLKV